LKFIKEVEIAYFRSFYKTTIYKCSDINIIFGKNDVGKSNIIRALNLFFNNTTDDETDFNFDIDFSDRRFAESQNSDGVRKFIYVKITFSTPKNYRKSLGNEFYVKRQWTVSRDDEWVEEVSGHIKDNQRHIVTRFINTIRFIHIPAIKSTSTFTSLLDNIYEILAESEEFVQTVEDFANRVQLSTRELFSGMPKEVTHESKISAPSRMDELFRTLDFETISEEGTASKSLTLQRGDGIKARHIPEILNFIASRDKYQFHIWGFEEPENSLDFVSAEAEAARFLKIALGGHLQIFVTTHSPSFYNLGGDDVRKFYVTRDESGEAKILQGRSLEKFDISSAIGEGFYLPAVAKALEEYSAREADASRFRNEAEQFRQEIDAYKMPIVLTEGKTDELILNEAWKRVRKGISPYIKIKSCDTTDGQGGGSAGASKLGLCLRAVQSDSLNTVIGLFDRDEAGIREWKLDATFLSRDLFVDVKSAKHKKAYGVLLPTPEYRTDCATCQNLPLEFLFSDEHIDSVVGEKRLQLTPAMATRKMGDETIRIPIGEETAFQIIDEKSKMDFAKFVVPKLPDEAFGAFIQLFDIIDGIIDDSKENE